MITTRKTSRGTAVACLAVAALTMGLDLAVSTSATASPTDAAARRASGIVFISDRDSPSPDQLTDEVYLYDTTTGRTSRLTTNDVAEAFPVLSPDGRYLAYLSNTGISVCPLSFAAGSWSCGPARGLVSDPSPVNGGRFTWTPDGRSIVYGGTDPVGGDVDIFSVNLFNLKPARNLTQEPAGGPAVFDGAPTVSPDGRYVVYGHAGDLYRRRIDGSDPVALTSTPTTEFAPAYSPDGSKIAFHSNRAGSFDIYVMQPRPESADNPAVDLTSQVTGPDGSPSRERYPAWSPDGTQIAFWWHVTPQGLDDGEIYAMRADGTGVENLTANNPTDPEGQAIGDITPAWGAARRR